MNLQQRISRTWITKQHGMAALVPMATSQLKSVFTGVRGTVIFEAPLRDLTSLRIGGPADALFIPEDIEDVCRFLAQVASSRIPWCVLGGTNLLIQDRGVRGIVLSLSKLVMIQDEATDMVYAEAGLRMPILLQHTMRRSLSGLEWAAGIPGTVGGSVVMNAGTQLGEMKDSLSAVRLVTVNGQVVTVSADSLTFQYRQTILPEGIVAGAWFQLTKASQKKIETAAKTYLQYRKMTQPLTRPNAGSIFKNPPGESAGRLIQEAGLKGARVGDAQVSHKHANFIVNLGQARATDVLVLIKKIQQTVFQRHGVSLELELKVIGES